jgi:hypothetical protein
LHEKAPNTPHPVFAHMVAVLMEQPRFEVPARIRDEGSFADSHHAGLLLADRIAAMPCIRTVENGGEALPSSVAVYLDEGRAPARKRMPPVTLCVIRRNDLTVYGLDLEDRRHLVTRGWGEAEHDRVRMFLPRDEREVDILWTILQHAHCALLNPSARSTVARHRVNGDLPRFSRTTLQ